MSNMLSVLSLNCWGLFAVSKEREFRLHAIADYIASTRHDVVALQEMWVWEDFEYLKTVAIHNYPHMRYFYSGALGSGLAILSRHPIVEHSYFRYALAGRPLKVFHGDFYVGKGSGSVCINHPEAGLIDIYTTHLHAGYGRRKEYEGHRITEAWELCKLMRGSAAAGRHVIAMGDFNALPTSFPYRLLIEHGAMTDSWKQISGFDMNTTPIDDHLTAEAAINVLGVTCDSPTNSWSKHFLKQSANKKKHGDRLDYIFYRSNPQMECVKSNVVLTENIPGTEMSYSDHFGVCSVFNVAKKDSKRNQDDACYSNLSQDVIDGIVTTLQSDQVASKKTANFLLSILAAMLFAIIALIIIIIALPTAFRLHDRGDVVTVIVTLFGGLLLAACALVAPVALIVGFVFGHTEQRALLQFLEEIETLKSVIKSSALEGDLIQMHDEEHSTSGRRRSTNGQALEQ